MVCGRGPAVEEAFRQVALGVFALLVDPASIEERETRVVRAHGAEPADLLVNWLNECLYLMEVEGFVARRAELITASLDIAAAGGEPLRLQGLLHGEEADPARHAFLRGLSAVGREGAGVRECDKTFEARVKTSV